MKRLYYLYLYKWAATHYKKKFSSVNKKFFDNYEVQRMFSHYTHKAFGVSILIFFSSLVCLVRVFNCNFFSQYLELMLMALLVGVFIFDHYMLSKNKYLPFFSEFENLPFSWHKVTNFWFRVSVVFLISLFFVSALLMTKTCF